MAELHPKELLKQRREKIVTLEKEQAEIKAWFFSTDYYAIKIARKEWTEDTPKWVAYVKEARLKAERLEEIKVELEKIANTTLFK